MERHIEDIVSKTLNNRTYQFIIKMGELKTDEEKLDFVRNHINQKLGRNIKKTQDTTNGK
jgi:hypothetical protein